MRTVEDILMTKGPDVIVASPDTTVFEAAKMMDTGKVGSVVIKAADELAGIFTERDLMKKVVARGKDPAATPLSDVMTSPLKTCRLSDDVSKVADTMAMERIRHLVVVEQGALVGLISLRDVLSAELRNERKRH